MPAGKKTQLAIPQEWGAVNGAVRPPEWQKTLGGIAREWEGEPSCRRA